MSSTSFGISFHYISCSQSWCKKSKFPINMIIQEFGDNWSRNRCLVILPYFCLHFCALGMKGFVLPNSPSMCSTPKQVEDWANELCRASGYKRMDTSPLWVEMWMRTAPTVSRVLPLAMDVSQREEPPKAQDLVCQALSVAQQLRQGRSNLISLPEQDNEMFSLAKIPLRSQNRDMGNLP